MATVTCEDCSKQCVDHGVNTLRINVLEEQLDIVKDNTTSVNKLAIRVNLLMSLMGVAVALVTGAATYTFTALSDFKSDYAVDRLALQRQLSAMEHLLDRRLDAIDNRLTTIEAVDSYNHNKNNGYQENYKNKTNNVVPAP